MKSYLCKNLSILVKTTGKTKSFIYKEEKSIILPYFVKVKVDSGTLLQYIV